MRIIAILSVLFFASFANLNAQDSNDAITKYFSKYMEDERFTAVFISPKMFDIFRKMDIDMDLDDNEAEAIKDVVNNMKSIRILTAEKDGKVLYEEATNLINTKQYEVLMTVQSGGTDNVQFLVKDDGDDVLHELLLLVGNGSDGEFVMMSFLGDINLSAIGKLANAFEDADDDDDDDNGGNKQQP